MKRKLIVATIALCSCLSVNAQNVGINTPSPTSSLDVNGGLRLRPAVTTVSGASVILANNRTHHVLAGTPTGDFTISIAGATTEGQHLIITNGTLFKGFLAPINILSNTTVELIYSASSWKLIGTSEPTSTTAWSRTGNAGTTDGVNNLLGTTDDKPLRFILNNIPSGKLDGQYGSYYIGAYAGNADNGNSWDTRSNSALGARSMSSLFYGSSNTAIGANSMGRCKSCSANTVIGASALATDTASDGTVAIGWGALFLNQSRRGNTAVGAGALYFNSYTLNSPILESQGLHNTALGYDALYNNSRGSGGVAIGYQAAFSDTAAEGIVAIGRNALHNNKGNMGNVAIGDSALYNNGVGATTAGQAIANTAVGSKALYKNTLGNGNTALGYNALFNNTAGVQNTALGGDALFRNSIGENNVAVGNNALRTTNGNTNTAIGSGAMFQHVSGANNVAIGVGALSANTSGSSNIAIGSNAGAAESTSNKLYIENSSANKNNALIYGDFAADSLLLNAKTVVRNNAVVRGFTKLGGYEADVPSIKTKKLVVTSSASSTGFSSINHGLSASKILSVTTLLEWTPGFFAPTEYSPDPLLRYNYFISPTQITIQNNAANCAYICSKQVKIMITYEE